MGILSLMGLRSVIHAGLFLEVSDPEARAGSSQEAVSLQPLSLWAPGSSCHFLPRGAGRETRAAGRRRGPFHAPWDESEVQVRPLFWSTGGDNAS